MTDWFASQLLSWYDDHGRRTLPWQHPRSPYRVWLSEIMLQQTQVRTVVPYFERFVTRYPDVRSLAAASVDDVLHLWSGLGYYSRARNLLKAAQRLVTDFDAEFPDDPVLLQALPGVGRSTAAAIAAMGFERRASILDGNVKRVLCRFHDVAGYPGEARVERGLWALAEEHTPARRVADYTQAIMDLGALLCTRRRPQCQHCPLRQACLAYARGTVDRLPTPRPRKALPVRVRTFFMVIRDDGACLLERRPFEGLWGGLWSPPERDAATTLDVLAGTLGIGLAPSQDADIEPFSHTFTHFQMQVTPVVCRAGDGHTSRIEDSDRLLWYTPEFNRPIGLSAVASRLLGELYGRRPR